MVPVSLAGLIAVTARIGVIGGTLATLFLVRTPVPAPLLFGVALASLGVLYLVEGQRGAFGAWALYFVGFAVFAYARGLADETGLRAGFGYAIDLERGVFGGEVPTLLLQRALYTPGSGGVLDGAAVAVHLSYFVVPHGLALLLWMTRRAKFGRYALELLGAAYLGLAASFLLPTAPPWLAGQSGHLPFVHRLVHDVLNGVDPSLYRQGYDIVGTNAVAAMPSLHMAMTAIVVVGAWRLGRAFGLVATAYAIAMAFSLVYTGEHYGVDVLAGVVTAAASVAATAAILRARPARLRGSGEGTLATLGGRAPAQADRSG
jgi:membrane-associated phospholipid phosphatase